MAELQSHDILSSHSPATGLLGATAAPAAALNVYCCVSHEAAVMRRGDGAKLAAVFCLGTWKA